MQIMKCLRMATFCAAGALGLGAAAATPGAAAMTQPLVHLYSDAKGVSHFRDETLVIPAGAAGPARLALSQTPGSQLLAIRLGEVETASRADPDVPHRAQGMSESPPGMARCGASVAGSVMLMDDLTGKGTSRGRGHRGSRGADSTRSGREVSRQRHCAGRFRDHPAGAAGAGMPRPRTLGAHAYLLSSRLAVRLSWFTGDGAGFVEGSIDMAGAACWPSTGSVRFWCASMATGPWRA